MYARRVTYRYTPGPYTPSDRYWRLYPEGQSYTPDLTYAEYGFASRFSSQSGKLLANSLPSRMSLLIVDIPESGYESDYAQQSLRWAWQGLEGYLSRFGWLEADIKSQHKEIHRSLLLSQLATRFDEDELRTLCFHLQIDFENLPATGKEGKAREMVLHLDRRYRIGELIQLVNQLRPDVLLDEIS